MALWKRHLDLMRIHHPSHILTHRFVVLLNCLPVISLIVNLVVCVATVLFRIKPLSFNFSLPSLHQANWNHYEDPIYIRGGKVRSKSIPECVQSVERLKMV